MDRHHRAAGGGVSELDWLNLAIGVQLHSESQPRVTETMSTATEEAELSIESDAYRILDHSSEDFVEAIFQVAEDNARQRHDRVVRMVDVRAAATQLIGKLTSAAQNADDDIEGLLTVLRKIEAAAHE